MSHTAAMLLRRALLRAADDVAEPQRLLACAETAEAVGERAAAALMEDLAALHAGFAPAAPGPAFAVERALAELAALMAIAPADDDGHDDEPEWNARGACTELAALLRASTPSAALAACLGRARALLARPEMALRDHVDVPLDLLVERFAEASLRALLVAAHDLAFAPPGSSALFHAAARLDPAGLGPYGRNLGNLLRDARDLFGLVEVAGGETLTEGARERWLGLLGGRLQGSVLAELVDELADEALAGPLAAILDGAARRPPARDDARLLARLRDAGLDLGEHALARRAQRLRADLTEARADWVLLGDIELAAGDETAAEATYVYSLGSAPASEAMRRRLDALRAGRRDFAPVGGITTSPGRSRARLARRGVAPLAYPDRALVAELERAA